MTTLREKITRCFPEYEVVLHCRDYLAEAVSEENPGLSVNQISGQECLFVNGRLLALSDFREVSKKVNMNEVYRKGDTVFAAKVEGGFLNKLKSVLNQPLTPEIFENLPSQSGSEEYITYPWDLIHKNGVQISEDFDALKKGGLIQGKIYEKVTLLNKDEIFIGKGAKVKPGVILDAAGGPIYIDEGAEIFPNAVIEGPAYIGAGTKIKVGAKIYEGTSIGPVCKVGGEVEESIIHSYSNKQHDGFLGHSYLGSWINIGADTNNSDLKNNYGNVKVYINGRLVDSGSQFVGLFMGDHAKSGINTMFNTGTTAGVMANIFGGGFPPKFIPSFSWGGAHGFEEYRLEKALDVARRVMERRDIKLSPAQEKVLRQVFEITRKERKTV